jgi:hypothetical protein
VNQYRAVAYVDAIAVRTEGVSKLTIANVLLSRLTETVASGGHIEEYVRGPGWVCFDEKTESDLTPEEATRELWARSVIAGITPQKLLAKLDEKYGQRTVPQGRLVEEGEAIDLVWTVNRQPPAQP